MPKSHCERPTCTGARVCTQECGPKPTGARKERTEDHKGIENDRLLFRPRQRCVRAPVLTLTTALLPMVRSLSHMHTCICVRMFSHFPRECKHIPCCPGVKLKSAIKFLNKGLRVKLTLFVSPLRIKVRVRVWIACQAHTVCKSLCLGCMCMLIDQQPVPLPNRMCGVWCVVPSLPKRMCACVVRGSFPKTSLLYSHQARRQR
jgi:hypothetical protein